MDAAEHNVLPLRLALRPARLADIELQPASLDIWDSKYRLKTKTGEPLDRDIDDTYRRVARTLADVETTPEAREHWHERFYEALRRGAVPAGRIISNAGARDHKPATSTINCTVSAVVRDSMDDILKKVHEAGLTLKAGCGIGYEFSTLRPRGAWVSGAGAQTSGPLSFMDIYDAMCFTVSSAGGRRGAQMATFDVGHPDAMEFIRAKREDGRLRQFNLSLLITREFVDAVRNDLPWKLAFPMSASEREQLDLGDPEQVVWRRWPARFDSYTYDEEGRVACRVYRTLPARRMWDTIMSSTYDFAEPGFVLIDEINEMNNNWFCEEIRATNPCVTADTWVQTAGGPRQVADLVGRRFEAVVDGAAHVTDSRGFFPTGRKRVVDPRDRGGISADPHPRPPGAPGGRRHPLHDEDRVDGSREPSPRGRDRAQRPPRGAGVGRPRYGAGGVSGRPPRRGRDAQGGCRSAFRLAGGPCRQRRLRAPGSRGGHGRGVGGGARSPAPRRLPGLARGPRPRRVPDEARRAQAPGRRPRPSSGREGRHPRDAPMLRRVPAGLPPRSLRLRTAACRAISERA